MVASLDEGVAARDDARSEDSRQRPDTFGQNLLGLTRRRRQESPIGPALVVDPGGCGAVLKLAEERARRSSRSLPGAEERDVAGAKAPSAHGARSHRVGDASSWRARTEPGQNEFALTVSRRARRAQAGMTACWSMVETRSKSLATAAHPEQEPEAKPLRSERAQRVFFGLGEQLPEPGDGLIRRERRNRGSAGCSFAGPRRRGGRRRCVRACCRSGRRRRQGCRCARGRRGERRHGWGLGGLDRGDELSCGSRPAGGGRGRHRADAGSTTGVASAGEAVFDRLGRGQRERRRGTW